MDHRRPPRITANDFVTQVLSIFCRSRGNGMGIDYVISGDKQALGPGKILDRVGAGAAAEGFEHSGDGRGVAEAGAVVEVVGAEGDADKLLKEVGVLVGAFCGGIAGQGIGAVGGTDFVKTAGDQLEGFLPGDRLVSAVSFYQRGSKALGALNVVVAEAPLDAE